MSAVVKAARAARHLHPYCGAAAWECPIPWRNLHARSPVFPPRNGRGGRMAARLTRRAGCALIRARHFGKEAAHGSF